MRDALAWMLFGVQPLDFVTFVLVVMVLGLTTATSIAGPAWRAARIDPATALRSKMTSGGCTAGCSSAQRAALTFEGIVFTQGQP